jgi:hypothetical protein
MAKKMKEWSGPLDDLLFSAYEVPDLWVIQFKGRSYQMGKKMVHTSEGRAKAALRKHIEANYHQGHYWHKGKKNTFADEGGHFRNGGVMAGLDKIFKEMGKETTEWLLNEGIFTIEKIKI